MASTIRDYSATAASNTTVDGADISEGCSPAGINDAIRGVMADLKDVSTGAVSLESPAADSLSLSGALTTTSTIDGRDVAADGAKLDLIDDNANNYVHPNHTGEVTSTADGATVIADNVVDEANLKVSNAPTNGYALTAQSGAAGGLTWAAIASGGGGDLLAANNLSDLDNAATARTNLGLGTAATTASTDYATAAQGTLASSALQSGDNVSLLTNNAGYLTSVPAQSFSSLTGKPTTISGYGITDVNSNIDTHLNTSTAATNEVLSWTGTDYDWVAQSGGGGADLYAANESSPTAQPSAIGANAVAIGEAATASGIDAFAVSNSTASGIRSVGIVGATASGDYSVAIGAGASSLGDKSVGIVGDALYDYTTAIGAGSDGSTPAIAGISNTASGGAVALGGAFAGGVDSFAAVITKNTNTYGATSTSTIAMGKNAKATGIYNVGIGGINATATGGAYALALGSYTTASGNPSIAIGTSSEATSSKTIAIGDNNSSSASSATTLGSGNVASSNNSLVLGNSGKADIIGKIVFSNGFFSAIGDSQAGQYILRADTTDATATVLTTNNSTAAANNQIVAASDTCITFDGTITAMQNGAQSYASWRIEGLLVNDAGTTTVANSAITVIDNQSNWGLTLTADTGNNCLAITFTGEAAHNIRTVGNIRTSEVTYS